jgi:hypothetical protein
MECDRTLGHFARGPKGELLLTDLPRDLYLDPDAEETLGRLEFARRAFGKDDDNFRLDPQPVEACKAEFARIDPPNPALGAPLRERLKPDQPFCYGRDYDPSHMRSHPAQLTTAIRVFRGPGQIASFAAAYPIDQWPDNADVMVRVTTRGNAKTVTQSFSCQGEGDQWNCSPSGDCENERRELYLRRDVNGGMALANPNSALAIVDVCSPEGRGVTKTDDKPDAALRLRAVRGSGRSVAGEGDGVRELLLRDRDPFDRQRIEFWIVSPQHVIAVEGERVGMDRDLIREIGLVERRAGRGP